MTGEIIIVEVPHQHAASAWTAYDWDDAADRCEKDGFSPSIITHDLADVMEWFADAAEAENSEAGKIAKQHGKVIEVMWRPNEIEYFAPGSEPTLEQVVRHWISDDLSSAYFLTSADDVHRFLADKIGHQWPKAHASVRNEAEQLGWIKSDSDDEDEDEE